MKLPKMTIKEELRPCLAEIPNAGQVKALFHSWVMEAYTVGDSWVIDSRPGGQVIKTLGLVETEDGKIYFVEPQLITFVDLKVNNAIHEWVSWDMYNDYLNHPSRKPKDDNLSPTMYAVDEYIRKKEKAVADYKDDRYKERCLNCRYTIIGADPSYLLKTGELKVHYNCTECDHYFDVIYAEGCHDCQREDEEGRTHHE